MMKIALAIRLIIGKVFLFFKARPKAGAFLLYVGVISLLYAPVVFSGKSLAPPLFSTNTVIKEGIYGYSGRKPVNNLNVDFTSGAFYDWPINKLISDAYKKGQLPLWNPYQGAGLPLSEQYGAARIFNPYQNLEAAFPVWSWDFFLLGRLLIAGFFAFLFLRLLNVSWLGAFLGGLFFMFSGSFTDFMQNEQMANTAMMIPVLLWTLEKLFTRPSGRNAALLAFIFALLFLAGVPGTILYTLLLAGAYFAFRIITSKIAKIKRFVLILLAFILGLGLASPLIFPFIEYLTNIFYIRTYGGAFVIPWNAIGLTVAPGIGELPTFYRLSPANGLWDSLGGYTGILLLYLIFLGCLISAAFLKRKIRNRHFPFFYFFLGFGLFIILKNFGPPFNWLGYLPFFNGVWSQRWAGPVWILCFVVAGVLGFELLKEERERIFELLKQSKNLKIFSALSLLILCALLTLPLVFYIQADTRLIDSTSLGNHLMRWEIFIGSWLASILIAVLAVYLTYSFIIKKGNKNALYGLLALALLELWLWIPRGYNLTSMRFKLGLFIFGAGIVLIVSKGKRLLIPITVLLFFISFLFLDIFASHGFPQRYNSFTEPPYIKYLKNQEGGYWRVMGDTTALFPQWASAFKIMDLRYVNGSGTILWYLRFKNNYLNDIPGENPVWFTGGKYWRTDINPLQIKKRFCPSITASEILNLNAQDQIENRIRTRLPFYSLLGMKYILTSNPDINKNIEKDSPVYFPLVYSGEVNIFENRSAFPRTFIVYDAEYAPSFQKAQSMLKKEGFDLRHKIILEEKLPPENNIGPEGENSASITDYDYNKVTISGKTDTPGILVLTDVFYPGWRATLDGKPAKVYRVDGLIRGIYLPKGTHEIVFSYFPPGLAKGLIAALLSLLACLVLIFFPVKNRRLRFLSAAMIIFLLGAPLLYFYFQNFLNFFSVSKFRTQDELDKEEETLEAESLKYKYDEERKEIIKFTYEGANAFATIFQDSTGKKWLPVQFLFAENESQDFYVDFRSESEERPTRRILINLRVIKNIFYDPDFSFITRQLFFPSLLVSKLKERFLIPEVLAATFSFYKQPSGETDAKIYSVAGYFEKVNNDWVLKSGFDSSLLGDNFVSYRYDCNSIFDWVKF